MTSSTDLARFLAKVEITTEGCWQWNAATNNQGYGHFRYKSSTCQAHRISYTFFVGQIPDGAVIDHLCRNRSCVNPSHLEPVTQRVNVLRGVGEAAIHAAKTHCKNGHPFSEENTRHYGTWRVCLACKEKMNRRISERRKRAREANAHTDRQPPAPGSKAE
jgi:HNH endonuclease